jgi:hypothetical protein
MKRTVLHILIFFVSGACLLRTMPRPHPHAGAVGWAASSIHFLPTQFPNTRMPDFAALRSTCKLHRRPVKLSEVRQLGIKLTLANISKRPVTLDFPTNQRIEIYLTSSEGNILTKWSDNHAIAEKPATILINPQERIEYNETIATRDWRQTRSLSPRSFFLSTRSCVFTKNSWLCRERLIVDSW